MLTPVQKMQVSFQSHILQERTVTVSEDDLMGLYEILRGAFLHYVKNFRSVEASPEEMRVREAIVAVCERHKINPEIAQDRFALFEALLGICYLKPEFLRESLCALEGIPPSSTGPTFWQTPGQMG